jgi:hypothetical protein
MNESEIEPAQSLLDAIRLKFHIGCQLSIVNCQYLITNGPFITFAGGHPNCKLQPEIFTINH